MSIGDESLQVNRKIGTIKARTAIMLAGTAVSDALEKVSDVPVLIQYRTQPPESSFVTHSSIVAY